MSKETDEQQPSELYDFLYRDAERIASYYAQIWNGRLLSVEETSSESENSEETVKGDIQVASTESKVIASYQSQNKRTIDMHDAATVDLLLRVTAQKAELRGGGAGSLHVFSGTCYFIDRTILKYAAPAMDFAAKNSAVEQQAKISRQQRKRNVGQESTEQREARALAESVKQLASMIDMPSGFILTVGDHAVCGPIKEAGLDQPISSLLFRAGNLGLANTYVVGIFEDFSLEGLDRIDSPMLKAQRELAATFFPLLFPKDAIRMTPLAIYRKVPI